MKGIYVSFEEGEYDELEKIKKQYHLSWKGLIYKWKKGYEELRKQNHGKI